MLDDALSPLTLTLTLTLTRAGDDYRADEPMLHSRAHLLKKLEIINSTGQLL
jgi:hypothetical protein